MEKPNKVQIHIGTIGYVDHSKTTLEEAINKYLKEKGLTLKLTKKLS